MTFAQFFWYYAGSTVIFTVVGIIVRIAIGAIFK